jgi:hypothetical protein
MFADLAEPVSDVAPRPSASKTTTSAVAAVRNGKALHTPPLSHAVR